MEFRLCMNCLTLKKTIRKKSSRKSVANIAKLVRSCVFILGSVVCNVWFTERVYVCG